MNTIRRAVLVSGGSLEKEFCCELLFQKKYNYLIGVDRGNAFLYEHQIMPTHIVGDFDSLDGHIIAHYKENTDIPIREYNPVKDASDTEMGVRLAIELGCNHIQILGATGTRLDHVWANVQLLSAAYHAGVGAEILDTHNKIRLIGGRTEIGKQDRFGQYFSVFPLGGIVEHFSIQGAKYPLSDHCLTPYDSLCVSNQWQEETVIIDFPKGIVILMETREE